MPPPRRPSGTPSAPRAAGGTAYTLDTTQDPPVLAAGAEPHGLTITILWHPDPARIGATAHTPCVADLSRAVPEFSDGAPLATARVSRSPVRLVATTGGLELSLGRPGLRAGLGADLRERVTRSQLERGLVLELGGLLLWVEPRWAPRAGGLHGLVGASRAMDGLRAEIERTAALERSVLLLGPTGSGKELTARAIHRVSQRARRPLVSVNMAALPSGTAAAQLFGHARGAFTGAISHAAGLFGEADGGTLFLDEIGACPLDVQVQLLRALDSGEVQPVGGSARTVSVRVISATDADLASAMASGRFHSALYHRLAACAVRLPPLAERPSDIPQQAVHFLRAALEDVRAAHRLDGPEAGWFGRDVVRALLAHPWPGNTRELAAVCEGLVARSHDHPACAVPRWELPAAVGPRGLQETLTANRFEVTATARALHIGVNTLRRRMAAAGLRVAEELSREEIADALERAGEIGDAAAALGVSAQGLRLRLRRLGQPLRG